VDPLFRHRARLGIGAFFALRFLGLIVYSSAGRLSEAGADSLRLFEALVVLGTVAALWGCWALARGKGYPAWLGLAGLAGILGIVVLALLPDRTPPGPAGSPPPAADGPRPD
jgi:hypothetical protein